MSWEGGKESGGRKRVKGGEKDVREGGKCQGGRKGVKEGEEGVRGRGRSQGERKESGGEEGIRERQGRYLEQ
ncbi:hypothetical protein Pmani_036742 [Petrolisthes manimaculis]|uniref:Uncharacterized protein n=1 Tax=Petrolisthes manimaculis TaxID=1843537 RepID=A0AAE1NJI8_9EUCA|nr:hypothetical protein Pmani_036742 [Petrolisthes manimaculis]